MTGAADSQPLHAGPKVLLVGFNRCGTRALAQLFERSGHPAVHHKIKRPLRPSINVALMIRDNIRAGRPMLSGLTQYRFFADLMWQGDSDAFDAFREYPRFLTENPDAILLLNLREREGWIASRTRHGHGAFVQQSMRLYGVATIAECQDIWRKEWDDHIAGLRQFVRTNAARLVEFDIEQDPIEQLIAALPEISLDPAHWHNVGAKSARNRGPLRRWLGRQNAARRFRA